MACLGMQIIWYYEVFPFSLTPPTHLRRPCGMLVLMNGIAPCFFSTVTTTLSMTAGWSNLLTTPHEESWPCTHKQEVTSLHLCNHSVFSYIYLICNIVLNADRHPIQKTFLLSVDIFQLSHRLHYDLSAAVQILVHLKSLWSTTLHISVCDTKWFPSKRPQQ